MKKNDNEDDKIFDRISERIFDFFIIKDRFISKSLIKKILILESFIWNELVVEDIYLKNGRQQLEDYNDDLFSEYNPKSFQKLFIKIIENRKDGDRIRITSKWIKSVIKIHRDLINKIDNLDSN